MGLRTRSGIERLLGLNLGFVWHGKEFDFLGGLRPTYTLHLRGENYSLTSGYSIRLHRGIINSRLYENFSLFLPELPAFRLTYARQGVRDTEEVRKVDSIGSDIQFGVEDEIGPFRISLDRRIHTMNDEIRGPEHNVESNNTSGDVNFAHSFGSLLSLTGRYEMELLETERKVRGKIEGETENYSLGFRFSPVRGIDLSVATDKRREERENFIVNTSSANAPPPVTRNDYLTNRFQLMLRPIQGIRLGAAYSTSDSTREADRPVFDESRSITVNIDPLRELFFSGRYMIRDSVEGGGKASTIRRMSFDMIAEFIERLEFSTRLDLSELTDFINALYNDRNSVTTKLETTLTDNLRADFSYDWQKSVKEFEGEVDRDKQHRLGLTANYSFARMLNLNLGVSKSISSLWGSDTRSSGALNYVESRARISLRYDRASSPVRSALLTQEGSSSPLREERRTTQTFTAAFDYEVGESTDLSLSYQGRIGSTGLGDRATRRISFRLSSRF